MRTDNYLIYPEAREKLRDIEERIKNSDIPYADDNPDDDMLKWMSGDIVSRGYTKTIDEELVKKHIGRLNFIRENRDQFFWKVDTPGSISSRTIGRKDIAVLMGYYASLVLEPNEIWDNQKYGFPGPFEFAGAVGALMLNMQRHEYNCGLKWEATHPDGTKYINEITADMICDLRIFQLNQTPYDTTDPLGNKVLYRPYMESDFKMVTGYHSTEGHLLVSVMKYAEQLGIDIKGMLNNPELDGLRQESARVTCTQHLGGFEKAPREFFNHYDKPMLQMDRAGNISERCYDVVMQSHMYGESQRICITHDGMLAFGSQQNDHIDVRVKFMPSEIENMLKGIIYQCANHLGRTSLRQIADIIEYKHSQKFIDDMAETRRFYSRMV